MNLADAVRAGEALGLARLDAQLLLLHALARSQHERAWLLAHDSESLAAAHEAAFLVLCRRRHAGEPLAYLVGEKEFYGLRLKVDARVLVPRPETETLVEWALEVLGFAGAHRQPTDAASAGAHVLANATDRRLAVSKANPSVIDLGTGSGAIALAIKRMHAEADVDAVDASADALAVAQANAAALGLSVDFRQGSWLADCAQAYDLIVGNPPYVAEGDPHLAALAHEPAAALLSGPDGLADLRAIIGQAPAHLAPGGWLLLEHGWDQAPAVRGLLAAAGLQAVQSRRDLAGIERCSGARRPELG